MLPSPGFLETLALVFVGSHLAYFGLSGASYLLFFVARRRHLRPEMLPPKSEHGRAIRVALVGNFVNVLLTAPLLWAVHSGYSGAGPRS